MEATSAETEDAIAEAAAHAEVVSSEATTSMEAEGASDVAISSELSDTKNTSEQDAEGKFAFTLLDSNC